MNADEQALALARMFRALGDPTRLRILMQLQGGEVNVGDLSRALKAPQPTISHHLGILRMGEFVVCRRQGKEVLYSISEFRQHTSARAAAAVLKRAATIRLGPLVLGIHRP